MIADLPTGFADGLPAADWRRTGEVVCEIVAGRSVLTRVRATDPLKLLTPSSHGYCAQVVMSTYGGGLLGGDVVNLGVSVRRGARLSITTQSAGKVYRTDGPASRQSMDAAVEDEALLAVLPDPLCPFTGARFEQRQHFDLAPTANLVWLDWLTSGRHGRGERWAMRAVDSRMTVTVGGQAVLRETLSLDAEHAFIGSAMRVGRFNCYAVLAMIGPALASAVSTARASVGDWPVTAVSPALVAEAACAGGAVVRVLGPDVQHVHAILQPLLSPIGDLLGQAPWKRKW